MDERVYWLWIQHAFGAGSSKPAVLVRRLGSVQNFYEAGLPVWQEFRFISEKELYSLQSFTLSHAEAMLEYCEKTEQTVLTPADAAYPERLRNLTDYPCALYVRGEIPPVDQVLTIAVVGARKAGKPALTAAHALSAELSACGAVIVSGGAMGIDTAAHTGALYAGGKTICVLPCGLHYPYLMENAVMREQIARSGALITEYPENSGVFRGNFTVRNRLISGLSHGVLVVSAAKKSGTLLTASCALEQNRDVFAVPGPADDRQWEGSRALLEDGARPVSSAQDILDAYTGWTGLTRPKNETPLRLAEEYAVRRNAHPQPETGKINAKTGEKASGNVNSLKTGQNHLDELSGDAVTLWQVLRAEPQHINDLAAQTGLPVYRCLALLTELELAGKCVPHAGGMYCRPD